MRISLGSDHGGLELKNRLVSHLRTLGHEVSDEGTYTAESCDYPVYAKAVADKLLSGQCDFGVLVCKTGIGMSIAANKIHGVRAALIHEKFGAEMCRRHNDANIICFGSQATDYENAADCLDIFLSTQFDGGRHLHRVEMFEHYTENSAE